MFAGELTWDDVGYVIQQRNQTGKSSINTKNLLVGVEESVGCLDSFETVAPSVYVNTVTSGAGPAAVPEPKNYTVTESHGCSVYICNYANCYKKFSSKSLVLRHWSVHSKEKPFACRFCKFRCSRKDNLRVHEINHAKLAELT